MKVWVLESVSKDSDCYYEELEEIFLKKPTEEWLINKFKHMNLKKDYIKELLERGYAESYVVYDSWAHSLKEFDVAG